MYFASAALKNIIRNVGDPMTAPRNSESERVRDAKALLDTVWTEVQALDLLQPPNGDLAEDIMAIFNQREKGWRYSIIIQVLGKATEFTLDALSLQEKDDNEGSWDAREFAKKVVVPWEASLRKPLGGSGDPYVNNIFRSPRYSPEMRRDRRSPEVYDKVFRIITAAQECESQEVVRSLLKHILTEFRRWLQNKSPEYPVPQRASLKHTVQAVTEFLSVRSGGARLQSVVFGLYKALGGIRNFYDEVKSRHVNAADMASGSSGDVECLRGEERALAVEVKDIAVTYQMVDESVTKARTAGETELLIIVNHQIPVRSSDANAVEDLVDREFSSGLNVYIESAPVLIPQLLSIMGEEGRRQFLEEVGNCLNEQNADYMERVEWGRIVRSI
jgi:hypothetical protein